MKKIHHSLSLSISCEFLNFLNKNEKFYKNANFFFFQFHDQSLIITKRWNDKKKFKKTCSLANLKS